MALFSKGIARPDSNHALLITPVSPSVLWLARRAFRPSWSLPVGSLE